MENLPNYCAHGVLQSPLMWLGIFTGSSGLTLTLIFRFFTLILMMYRIREALLMGIFLTPGAALPQ